MRLSSLLVKVGFFGYPPHISAALYTAGMTEGQAPQTDGRHCLGIDIGGSALKGAVVDVDTGRIVGQRIEIATPSPATPPAVAAAAVEIASKADWCGPVGIALPSVITRQVARTAANIDPSWVGTDVAELFSGALDGQQVAVLNDADAAGLAEVSFGDGAAREGSVLFLTFGTGIGSAFLADGVLFANTELGHLLIDDTEAEHFASSAVRTHEGLSYEAWARRVDTVLHEYERLFSPTTFVVGGGISQDADKWVPLLTVNAPVVPARLRNSAGIVGAALAVHRDVAP